MPASTAGPSSYAGEVAGILKKKGSITGQYLSGKRSIPVPTKRRSPGEDWLVIRGAREHNLQDIDVHLPLGMFITVTGVSGSGKSTLVRDILLPSLMQKIYKSKQAPGRHKTVEGIGYLDKVIDMDQSPIGRTPRSNPATYTGVFDHVRKLFAQTAEAKIRGYLPGRFSFNVSGGRCEACSGDGTIKIEMHFLPDVYVPCEVCKGARYNRDTLDITFKGKNIAEVLDLPCEEALTFFANQPVIARHMQTIVDVGLGYVRLGQPAPTLSGGEAQRVKLSSELAKRSTGHTIYLLDEPTTGLHFEDVRRLLTVLSRLVDQGNTVLVIEHNLDVIKTADWIVDLGPYGGSGGGTIVAEGSPEHVATVEESFTGQFLGRVLSRRLPATRPTRGHGQPSTRRRSNSKEFVNAKPSAAGRNASVARFSRPCPAAVHRSAASAEMLPLVHPFAPRRRALSVRRSMASAEPLKLSTPGWWRRRVDRSRDRPGSRAGISRGEHHAESGSAEHDGRADARGDQRPSRSAVMRLGRRSWSDGHGVDGGGHGCSLRGVFLGAGVPIEPGVLHRGTPSSVESSGRLVSHQRRQLGPVAEPQLGQDVRYMALDGLAREEYCGRDLRIGRSSAHEERDLPLPARQR